jgi:hypothetical protein
MKKNDVYELNPHAWYFKLLNYTLGLEYTNFAYVCPLFWLTLLVVLVSPVLLPAAFLVRLVRGIYNRVREQDRTEFLAWADLYYHDISTNPTSLAALKKIDYWNKKNRQIYRFIYQYLHAKDWKLWRELVDEGWIHTNAEEEEKKRKKKDLINTLVKYAKPVGYILMTVFFTLGAATIIYLLYLLGVYLFNMKSGEWLLVMWILLGIIGLFIGIFLVDLISERLPDRTKERLGDIGSAILRVILWPFAWLLRQIGKFFSFLAQMVSDYCPAIRYK